MYWAVKKKKGENWAGSSELREFKGTREFLMFLHWQIDQLEVEDVGIGKGLTYKNKLFYYPTQQADWKLIGHMYDLISVSVSSPLIEPLMCQLLLKTLVIWRWKRYRVCPLRSKGQGLLAKGAGHTGRIEQKRSAAQVHCIADLIASIYYSLGKK